MCASSRSCGGGGLRAFIPDDPSSNPSDYKVIKRFKK